MKTEEYKKAWEKFQERMDALKRRQFEVLARIGEKLDRQKMDKIREELK